jgi:hypothetical protein
MKGLMIGATLDQCRRSPRMRFRWADLSPHYPIRCEPASLLLLLLIVGCVRSVPLTPVPEASVNAPDAFAGREAECLPDFPDRGGWYGGDAAYSIPLPTRNGSTSLWLFGDSFVEQPNSSSGRQYPFIHNSIALTRCAIGGNWHLEYFWRRDQAGTPRAFFEPNPAATWVRNIAETTGGDAYYWLFDGFIAHDSLFIGLLRVGESRPRGPFRLPFELFGMDLARIDNFRDPPEEWIVRISTLSESRVAFPGSAFIATEGFIYAFGFLDFDDGRAPRILTRLEPSALVLWKPDLTADIETLTESGEWISGVESSAARILMQDDASEMSVHFDVSSQAWFAVYSDPIPDPDSHSDGPETTRIWLRRAERLEGPWGPPVPLIAIPEMRADPMRAPDDNLFCYAAKAHPQFSTPGELVVTYVCNLFSRSAEEVASTLRRLQDTPTIYRPRALSISIPRDQEGPTRELPTGTSR